MNETAIRYISAAVLGISLFLSGGGETASTISSHEETAETYKQTINSLTAELERVTRELNSSMTRDEDIVEVTQTKKDGSSVTRKKTKRKEKTIVKQIEVKETEKVSESAIATDSTKRTETARVETNTSSSGGRLGLDISIGSRIDRELAVGWTLDVSYEYKYRLAPRLGIEMNTTLSAPKAITVGLEIRL